MTGVFIDITKAFDTIDHSILLSKLEHYGLRGIAIIWLSNYLSNRKQYYYIMEQKQVSYAEYPKDPYWGQCI